MFVIKRIRHLLVILAVVLIVVFFRWNGRISLFEQGAGALNGLLMNAGYQIAVPVGSSEEDRSHIARIENENAILMKRLAGAEEEVLRLGFEKKIEAAGAPENKGIVARVVARDLESWHSTVVVDRGARDGVREGFIALTGDGLVGRVIEVSRISSRLLLVTGNGAATSAVVLHKKKPGMEIEPVYCIAYGNGTGQIAIKAVPSPVRLSRGDKVVTSGYGGHYPTGLPLGRVSKVVVRSERLSPIVTVRPAADMKNLYYIVLVAP
jgi:rod shape-determining protein MreC